MIDRLRRLLFGKRARTTEPDAQRVYSFRSRTAAGEWVDEDVALTYTAVWSCVRVIAETIGSLKFGVFSRRPDGGREPAPNHPVNNLLGLSASPEVPAGCFREVLQAHALLWGNGYAEIERDRSGRPVALHPIGPDRVTVARTEEGALRYEITNPSSGQVETSLPPERVFHLRGLGFDGLRGYSPVTLHRQAIGLGLGVEKFGGTFFGNGAFPSGIYTYPGELDDEAFDNLKDSIKEYMQDQAHSVLILEDGTDYKPFSVPPDDAQFLQTRRFQLEEVSRIFRVPLSKLNSLEKATFNNVEQQSLQFVSDTLLPWVEKWESEADRKLFGRDGRRTHFSRLKIETLLRGDLKSRYDAYAIGRNWGWLSADDIRALEDLNPLPDGLGKLYLVPANMITAEQAAEPPAPPPPQLEQTPTNPDTEAEAEDGEGEEDRLMGLLAERLGHGNNGNGI